MGRNLMGEVLTIEEMYRADALAIEGGVPGIDLMEAAGVAVADAVLSHAETGTALILCGPGNNGVTASSRRVFWPKRDGT